MEEVGAAWRIGKSSGEGLVECFAVSREKRRGSTSASSPTALAALKQFDHAFAVSSVSLQRRRKKKSKDGDGAMYMLFFSSVIK